MKRRSARRGSRARRLSPAGSLGGRALTGAGASRAWLARAPGAGVSACGAWTSSSASSVGAASSSEPVPGHASFIRGACERVAEPVHRLLGVDLVDRERRQAAARWSVRWRSRSAAARAAPGARPRARARRARTRASARARAPRARGAAARGAAVSRWPSSRTLASSRGSSVTSSAASAARAITGPPANVEP